MRREEDLKLREKALENLRIKGAFGAQELYDKHRGENFRVEMKPILLNLTLFPVSLQSQSHLATLSPMLSTIPFSGMIDHSLD